MRMLLKLQQPAVCLDWKSAPSRLLNHISISLGSPLGPPFLITSITATVFQVIIFSWLLNLRKHILDFFITSVCSMIKWLLVLNSFYNFSFCNSFPTSPHPNVMQDTESFTVFELPLLSGQAHAFVCLLMKN